MIVAILWFLLIIGVLVFLCGLILWGVSYFCLGRDNIKLVTREVQNLRPAVLIPARYESNVVEGILSDLKKQSFPLDMTDVYVIVEDETDPTVRICDKKGASCIVRQNLSSRTARKGFALDEAMKAILASKKQYDLYFIFDADNRINEQFIEKMILAYQAGYQMATSYRNASNVATSAVATCSALTFSMLNTVENRRRVKLGWNIVFSGTGCFIDGKLVEKWHGWPFRSLTEDYEMSLYAILRGVKTTYFEEAEFFDEQPETFKQSFTQRLRWLKGYFSARKKYIPLIKQKKNHARNLGSVRREIIGMWPFILIAVGAIWSVFIIIVLGFVQIGIVNALLVVAGVVGVIYLVMLLVTVKLLTMEKYQLTFWQKLKAALYNPIYLVSYVPCAVVMLLKRNITWDKIQHGK